MLTNTSQSINLAIPRSGYLMFTRTRIEESERQWLQVKHWLFSRTSIIRISWLSELALLVPFFSWILFSHIHYLQEGYLTPNWVMKFQSELNLFRIKRQFRASLMLEWSYTCLTRAVTYEMKWRLCFILAWLSIKCYGLQMYSVLTH